MAIHIFDEAIVNLPEPQRSKEISEQIARVKADLMKWGVAVDAEWDIVDGSPHAVIRSESTIASLARAYAEKAPQVFHVFIAQLSPMKAVTVRAAFRQEGAATDTQVGLVLEAKVFRGHFSTLTHELGRAAGLWSGDAKHDAHARCTCVPEGER